MSHYVFEHARDEQASPSRVSGRLSAGMTSSLALQRPDDEIHQLMFSVR
jgi:hypothetical protein